MQIVSIKAKDLLRQSMLLMQSGADAVIRALKEKTAIWE